MRTDIVVVSRLAGWPYTPIYDLEVLWFRESIPFSYCICREA